MKCHPGAIPCYNRSPMPDSFMYVKLIRASLSMVIRVHTDPSKSSTFLTCLGFEPTTSELRGWYSTTCEISPIDITVYQSLKIVNIAVRLCINLTFDSSQKLIEFMWTKSFFKKANASYSNIIKCVTAFEDYMSRKNGFTILRNTAAPKYDIIE